MAMQRIRKGDTVMVTRGRERGKSGTVLRTIPERSRVVIDVDNDCPSDSVGGTRKSRRLSESKLDIRQS